MPKPSRSVLQIVKEFIEEHVPSEVIEAVVGAKEKVKAAGKRLMAKLRSLFA